MAVLWLGIPALCLLTLAGFTLAGKIPPEVFCLYLGTSILAFLAFLFDKSAARSGSRRTPENSLHLLGLIGGWPGALIAQRLLHHKTRKVSFQVVFWASVLVNCSALIWILSPSGSHLLHYLP